MKCTKVKNPCKICFQPCSKKNAVQCQGACRKWAHFKCLNYTPGKIQDIKTGVIKITCPCPDCNTSGPKEMLTEPPFTCSNTKCAANLPPVCESQECPTKRKSPIPTYPQPPIEQSLKLPEPTLSSSPICEPTPENPPTAKCLPSSLASPNGTLFKCPPECDHYKKRNRSPSRPLTPTLECVDSNHIPKTASQVCGSPPCTNPKNCPSNQRMKKSKKECSPKQSQSCSAFSNYSSCIGRQQTENLRVISSDSQVPSTGSLDQKVIFSALADLCNTVGQLSTQLKDLMCKMQEKCKV